MIGKKIKELCEIIFLSSLQEGGECSLNSRSIIVLGLIKNKIFYGSFENVKIEKDDEILILMNAN